MTKTTNIARVRRTALALLLPLSGAFLVAGCSSPSDGQGAGSSSSASSAAGPTAGAVGDDATALTAAAATALDAVPSSRLLSIERERGGSAWEILVASADGTEHEVHTDAAGTTVTAGPTSKSTDADDLAENKRFLGDATVTAREAAATLTETVDGSVAELGLDDHLGKTVWEGDVIDSAGTKHSIRLDAGTGDVVTNAVDTDD
ncbi:hypothetical protein GCM10025867_44940 [Frondihabitans sucicola]|uniref:PepSY domain-containing protein n=1 Tax=Frondihabitans sucicola TaxID=1268041 RepID=A0ABN6XVW3_9MICO|nr:PepSY domain-containing protein [Frondihabitans sucicola]BDZ47780.1 hypothetical protein GCM10025867_00210 [Frondihabitans sucicola]BDZ52253.1 hypothetical protein GCM10025867_44940 [Frondihabitans sucicola]